MQMYYFVKFINLWFNWKLAMSRTLEHISELG